MKCISRGIVPSTRQSAPNLSIPIIHRFLTHVFRHANSLPGNLSVKSLYTGSGPILLPSASSNQLFLGCIVILSYVWAMPACIWPTAGPELAQKRVGRSSQSRAANPEKWVSNIHHFIYRSLNCGIVKKNDSQSGFPKPPSWLDRENLPDPSHVQMPPTTVATRTAIRP